MNLFLFPAIFIISLFLLPNFLNKFLKIDNFEKPIYGLGLLLLILNYFYFNLNISIKNIFILYLILTFIGIISIFFQFKYFNKNFKIILILLFSILLPLTFIGYLYGEQFYVFRGNIYDHFVYLSTGLTFNSFKYSELINFKNQFPESLGKEFYLKHVLNLIHSRPSIQLLLGFLINFKFLNIIEVPFVCKIIISILVAFGSFKFFLQLTNKLRDSLFLAIGFVFSFFYFYNFEIDAYSLILSLPFLFLIFAYIVEAHKNFETVNTLFIIKLSFVCAVYFVIYPNGGSIIFIPISIYFLFLLKTGKNFSVILKNYIILILISLVLILPTFKTTVFYLIDSQITAGLTHSVDFWGYYGAFILGKDNPIHNQNIIDQIKELWSNEQSLLSVLPAVLQINIDYNKFFLLNIIPSIFGYFHLSTSQSYGLLNYILIGILFFLNINILKRLYKNFYTIFKKNKKLLKFFKINLFYFVIFFVVLNLNDQIWSSIKLYFILSPIFFTILILDFTKQTPKFNKKYLLILLIILPVYKYSHFNSGIGVIDSFPSIIKKETKTMLNWNIKLDKLKKCSNLNYQLSDKFQKIYISLIYKTLKLDYHKKNCNIKTINKNFVIDYF